MQIGIIGGTGAEGRGLAARLAAAGVAVLVGSRQLDRAAQTVDVLRTGHGALPLEPATNEHIVERSDVMFLAVPFAGAAEFLDAHRSRFRDGTLVVDVTVPLTFAGGFPAVVEVPEGSAAELVRARVPAGVRVAAAFKTIPASLLEKLDAPLDCDEFVCGDSADARETTVAILRRIPTLRPIDAGGLQSARTIERMTALAVVVNKRYKIRSARFRVVGLEVS